MYTLHLLYDSNTSALYSDNYILCITCTCQYVRVINFRIIKVYRHGSGIAKNIVCLYYKYLGNGCLLPACSNEYVALSGCFLVFWYKIIAFSHITLYAVHTKCGWVRGQWRSAFHRECIYAVTYVLAYTVSQKSATLTMAITLSVHDRFAKFFHCCKEH